jgi:hypothetical protein
MDAIRSNQSVELTAARHVLTLSMINHFHFEPRSLSVAVAHFVFVRSLGRRLFA